MTWEHLRSMWVNGERAEALEEFNQLHPKTQIAVCLKAVVQSYKLNHQSGDLIDLIEFLREALK